MSISYSSVTKKIWMSLMGFFLMTFLIVHLSINLLLVISPTTDLFNEASHFMGTNPFIQAFQWILFAGFIVHIIIGVVLQIENWMARPKGYRVKAGSEDSFFSKYMIHTGVIIFIFLIIHFVNFFLVAKGVIGEIPETMVDGKPMDDMGSVVIALFQLPYYMVGYLVALLILGFHLDHGFQSAFQSLGLNHPTYTPFIKGFGHFFAVIIAAAFMIIPLFIYFSK
ncbi:MAG: succinate dehydrogenase cytochrome b subunit [Bacteroidales bacterium]|nr:succinate dehydrogenase cytochrome b subunit [Bacteroidales bacterium]